MPLTQEKRSITINTPLGKDALLLTSLSGKEEISRLYSYQLGAISENTSIAAKDIVGKSITAALNDENGKAVKFFSGFVSRFGAGQPQSRTRRSYRLEIVPWLWFLTLTADCRIFQNKSVPDIIKQIFGDLGFSDYKFNLSGSYSARPYCVQYRETDFNFISRLMEEEGIFYFFTHENGKHTMVIADRKTAYQDLPQKEVPFAAGILTDNHIFAWSHLYEFRPGKYAQTDYSFETPSTSLMSTVSSVVQLPGNSKYEVYDYPGEYLVKGDGDGLSKVRMEELEVSYDVAVGSSTCKTFTPGGKFKIKSHDCDSEVGLGYAITSVEFSATDTSYVAGEEPTQEFRNSFTAIPDSVNFRPARTTPRPVIQGLQTAVVVGPKGEEIYVDKYGRVKVQFYWDREGKKDENTSCWVRVAENWAGKNWGIVFNPRIGQEVIVDFLEGDPDKPLITGRVYNAEQMPPYDLPANMTQSGVKTRSSKGGGTDNFNELRFEDKKGSEDIFFHAEKDFHREVENDDDLKVLHDQTIMIKNKRTETVKEGDETITIETGNRVIAVNTGNDTHQIKTGNREVKIDMGNDSLKISMGNQTTKLDLGQSSTEAMQSIELKVGQNSVKIDQMGVTIQGMMVKVSGQIQTQIEGVMTQVKGTAMLQAQGGITMIG
jgi:type VI secretion system secreted protein VgrG